MFPPYISAKGGFLRLIAIVIFIVAILALLSIDVREIAESTEAKSNFVFIQEVVKKVWNVVLIPIFYMQDVYCNSTLGISVCEAFRNAVPR